MSIEVAIALFAAVRARSVALAAFGGDGAIELMSAAAVLWRFRSTRISPEQTATKITGPRFLGVWLVINGCAYPVLSFTGLLLPQYENRVSDIAFPVLSGEVAFMLWLLIMGAKPRAPAIAASSSAGEFSNASNRA